MSDPAEPETDAQGTAAPGPGRHRRRHKGGRRALVETAITAAVAVLVVFLLRAFAFQTFWIPSTSMVPTLSVNDRILVQKAFFTWHDVHEGDIVVFSQPPLDRCGGAQGDDLVKRVIG